MKLAHRNCFTTELSKSSSVAQHSAGSRHTDPLHTITSRTYDCQNTPRAISFSAAHVDTVGAPGLEDKACPSNLLVSKDAPAQSQHTHSAGTSQPTTTLRSGEHSAFHTTTITQLAVSFSPPPKELLRQLVSPYYQCVVFRVNQLFYGT